jgi:hypothetical protein
MTVDELIDGWEAAWSGQDPAAFAEVCAAGVQYEDPLTTEPLVGTEQLGRHAARLWAGFPDARLERTGERLANGHFVAAPCKALGTHREPLEGLLRVRGFYDVYNAATQLGVLPGRGTLGEKALLMVRGFGLRARG